MTLDTLVLHNFGVYLGRNTLDLAPPSAAKPVILIGGLNGVGKTTLLDAVRLALFGQRAGFSNRGAQSYDDYLRSVIHRDVPRSEGAAVELSFRHRMDGIDRSIRIKRYWHETASGVRKRLEVELDDVLDPFLSEHWLESVDQFVPVGISRLVFFDGEQIESLADPETSTAVISSGISGLLGLDVVDRLHADLAVYGRRQRLKLKSDIDREEVLSAERELQRLDDERARLATERGACQNALDKARRCFREEDARFRRDGGDLFEKRADLETKRENLLGRLAEARNDLLEQAAGASPLLLVTDLLDGAVRRGAVEASAQEALQTNGVLEARDSAVVKTLRKKSLDAATIGQLETMLARDRRKRMADAAGDVKLDLPGNVRHRLVHLNDTALPELRPRLADACAVVASLRNDLDFLERQLAAVPATDAIASLISARSAAQAEVDAAVLALRSADDAMHRITGRHDNARDRYERLLARDASLRLDQDDVHRAMTHASRVRDTLDRFRRELISRSTRRIADLVFDGYRHLLRKQRLVSGLDIDPQSLTMTLRGANNDDLDPESLSSGERQLLAVALLWGLARAAGRPLPAIVDTPLGRLDSSHREHLVERYFPSASHQVLLLSTDEEVSSTYWRKLRPHVGRAYTLIHDDVTTSTRIENGYFW